MDQGSSSCAAPPAVWDIASRTPPPLDFDLSIFFKSHITKPVKYWDPYDPNTRDYSFENLNPPPRKYLLYPPLYIDIPPSGLEITGSFVFELYSIEIKKIDPRRDSNFSTVLMQSSATDMIRVCIYKRPKGEEVILNKPLALEGPFRPPNASYSVIIGLSNPANGGWVFHHDGPDMYFGNNSLVYDSPVSEAVKDGATDSVAVVWYELMKSAATATLFFEFLDDKGRNIEILSGSIEATHRILSGTATHKGDERTKRLIKRVLSNKPEMVKSNEPFPVGRPGFGVPIGSELRVFVELMYRAGAAGTPKKMTGSLLFPVQQESKVCEDGLSGDDPTVKLRVRVSWSSNKWEDI